MLAFESIPFVRIGILTDVTAHLRAIAPARSLGKFSSHVSSIWNASAHRQQALGDGRAGEAGPHVFLGGKLLLSLHALRDRLRLTT